MKYQEPFCAGCVGVSGHRPECRALLNRAMAEAFQPGGLTYINAVKEREWACKFNALAASTGGYACAAPDNDDTGAMAALFRALGGL